VAAARDDDLIEPGVTKDDSYSLGEDRGVLVAVRVHTEALHGHNRVIKEANISADVSEARVAADEDEGKCLVRGDQRAHLNTRKAIPKDGQQEVFDW
jgi:hypothetical protein